MHSDDVNIAYQGVFLAGVDEVGRGPLVGNVVAAAVILDPQKPVPGLTDSKKLSAKQREHFYTLIQERALAIGVGEADVEEIDRLNILWASMLAMQRAVSHLNHQPEFVVVDGNRIPQWEYPSQAIIKGDLKVACISAASIVAKVVRDRQMLQLAQEYPAYGFDKHKGYPTKAHLEALAKHGPLACHRQSFKPVKNCLAVTA